MSPSVIYRPHSAPERLAVLAGPKRYACHDRIGGYVAVLRDVLYVDARCMFAAAQIVQRDIARGAGVLYSLHVARRTPGEMWPSVS